MEPWPACCVGNGRGEIPSESAHPSGVTCTARRKPPSHDVRSGGSPRRKRAAARWKRERQRDGSAHDGGDDRRDEGELEGHHAAVAAACWLLLVVCGCPLQVGQRGVPVLSRFTCRPALLDPSLDQEFGVSPGGALRARELGLPGDPPRSGREGGTSSLSTLWELISTG